MAGRKKQEDELREASKIDLDFSSDNSSASMQLDEETINEKVRIEVPKLPESYKGPKEIKNEQSDESPIRNCLKNEKVFVRFLARKVGGITDPNHVMYGGLHENAHISLPVPMLRSGLYADVLTKQEKKFLEFALGLEPNALSIYKKENNFWDDSNENGVGYITLSKQDTVLDLSKPMDYIKYKILLAYPNLIAPNMQVLADKPKETYKFVLVNDSESAKSANTKVAAKARAYMEFGKVNEDANKMIVIIETMEGKPTASATNIETLQGKIGELIESNTKLFLQVVTDPLLDNKVLIRTGVDAGVISKRGTYFYFRESNLPLCDEGQEPTFSIAANFLSLPKNKELKFTIEGRIRDANNKKYIL